MPDFDYGKLFEWFGIISGFAVVQFALISAIWMGIMRSGE
jgi:hypothetical protein